MEACIFVAVLIVVAGGSFGVYLGLRVLRLRREYAAAIAALRADPANHDLRERALAVGRAYAEAEHSSGAFSELHLMNDINAACARAAQLPPQPQATIKSPLGSEPPGAASRLADAFAAAQSQPRPTIEQRLARLEALRAAGHISEQECAERRREILAEV